MINIINLQKTYGNQTIFDNVTFSVNSREKIGLVGRNGHGKSTLFKIIIGEEKPENGKIIIPKGYTIAYLSQTIKFNKPTLLEEAILGLPKEKIHDEWRVKAVLLGLGFSKDDWGRSPYEFSGGFQVRINLAKALVSDADLLLLDEPTNYLDIVSIRWLAQYLKTWPKELMLITHDQNFMNQVITHVLGLHRKTCKKIKGDTNKYYNYIKNEETKHEKDRIKIEQKEHHTMQFINKFRAKARQGSLAQSRIKMLEKTEKPTKLEQIKSINFVFPSLEFQGNYLLSATNISYSFNTPQNLLFSNLNLQLTHKDKIGIIGPNGKGKSTLLKVLNEKFKSQTGTIKKHPQLISGFMGQSNEDVLDKQKTIMQELSDACNNCSEQKVRDICGNLLFTGEDSSKKISVLSGGEKNRVQLGKLLLTPSHLLMLDEPTNHLDMESDQALISALKKYKGALLIVTHNENLLRNVANKLIIFDRNKVQIFNGTYDDFLSDIGWQEDKITDFVNNKIGLDSESKKINEENKQVMKSLKQNISKIEKEIEKLENVIQNNNLKLLKASQKQNIPQIKKIAKKNHDFQERINQLYTVLEEDFLNFDKFQK